MSCNLDIHNELIEMGESYCSFCKLQLMEVDIKHEMCCDQPDIINDNNEIVCKNCGLVQGYKHVKEYINFHENMYKIRRKSVYHRKYHIENVINKANIKISRDDRDKIYKVFDEIEKMVPLIDSNRKRMISINFIIRKLFSVYMPHIPYVSIRITKSDKTLKYYEDYWKSIVEMIGVKIKKIIR